MLDIRRRGTLMLAAAVAAAACMAVAPGASAAPAGPVDAAQRLAMSNPWGNALEVPGTAALNKAGLARITSVSCASAGNCSAGGFYASRTLVWQAFVVSEVHGTWRKAEEVPGTAALNKDGRAGIRSVSCGSAGNCSAGGYYTGVGNGGGQSQEAFVVSEVDGIWRRAEEVPGSAALNKGEDAEINSVSCASARNCSAGGSYWSVGIDAGVQAFAVSEVNGTWRKAEEVPGTAALNTGGYAAIDSVSCASAGNCSAGGSYLDGPRDVRTFVVSEVHGRWRKAEEVPGIAALSDGEFGGIPSVSCASAGNCSAGGYYSSATEIDQAFVVSEVNGTWGKAEEVPGTAAPSENGGAEVSSVSCASAGNCSAGGEYVDVSNISDAFVVSQVNGTWGIAEDVPGTAALSKGRGAEVTALSCASAGNCSAGGTYQSGNIVSHAFVVSQVNGTWRRAEEVPGTAALSKGGETTITSVSCASAGHCSAGGTYVVGSDTEVFVVSRR